MYIKLQLPVLIFIAWSLLSQTLLVSAWAPRINRRSNLQPNRILATFDNPGSCLRGVDSKKLYSSSLQSTTAPATTLNDNTNSENLLHNNVTITSAIDDTATTLSVNANTTTISADVLSNKKDFSGVRKNLRKQHFINLISLPPKDDSFLQSCEKLVRDCWRWKDTVLGDGRDFFVPRPRALKAFQGLFVGMEVEVFYAEKEFGLEGDGMSAGNPSGSRGKYVNGNDSGVGGDENRALFQPFKVFLNIPSFDKGEKTSCIFRIPLESQNANDDEAPLEPELTSESFIIEECAALSNCARLDVILVLRKTRVEDSNQPKNYNATISMEAAKNAALFAVAYNLERQVQSQQSKPTSFLQRTGFSSWFDLPGAVDVDTLPSASTKTAATTASITTTRQTPILELTTKDTQIIPLASRLILLEGAPSIIQHLALIAGGLSPRPNRPNREVIFRPYSSRDAHILLQLKRTVEVISTLNGKTAASATVFDADVASSEQEADNKSDKKSQRNFGGGGGGRIKIMLEWALNAGKAVRNEAIVPQIRELKEYGSDRTPPVGLASKVAASAIELGIEPSVTSCIERLAAMETSEQISQLRWTANEIVNSVLVDEKSLSQQELQKIMNGLLHLPTMRVRKGSISDDELIDMIDEIEWKLRNFLASLKAENKNNL